MCHVLIIEDEWFICEYLKEVAHEAGATSIATAATQDDAVAAARDEPPAIILSDVKLRAGTGPRAVQTIFAEMGSIPVIFITGTPDECQPCDPPAVILGKPVEARRVIETFRQLAPV
ncbi:response regulator [Novosphingobium album (ex Liu et al. 2023)]|uniref:Response regulator n=1 Tax=Novosphingobium album (ex Liu et al. 2023) TaxID=3031130 RepID=A0ABT5WN31_9SPHN|nr:response regulator [Novosphingobium album (ex Liu et al. 2023)]MDE8651451.1 response regulator [Novosphingobium album (ex Liu et al. 2023)]